MIGKRGWTCIDTLDNSVNREGGEQGGFLPILIF